MHGEFHSPNGITVLESSGEVAVSDGQSDRVQIFDHEGNYLRKFGTSGKADGQFTAPWSLASDAHDNILVADWDTCRLQVFNSKGKHLCTRSDLGLAARSQQAAAWGVAGQLAVADGSAMAVRVWWASGSGSAARASA